MPIQAPKIDQRSYRQLIERTEHLARLYAGWQPYPDGRNDGGRALIRIFARMAEVLIERLNRVPEKNFLAFLDLIGTQILPPQAARVPLTFRLAAGSSSDALVPARTQVAAAPAPDDPGPVLFETERDLVVTRSELGAVFVREPERDGYAGDAAAIATGKAEGSFLAFVADTPVPHYLYLSHRGFFADPRPKRISVGFYLNSDDNGSSFGWLAALRWTFWDGQGWQAPSNVEVSSTLVSFVVSLPVAARSVGGVQGTWLRAELLTTLPRTALSEAKGSAAAPLLQRRDQLPDAGLAAPRSTEMEAEPIDFTRPCAPFGLDGQHQAFYLAWDEGFAKPGAGIMIDVELDPQQPVEPAAGLALIWEYSAGAGRWLELGHSSPSDEGGEGNFSDTTGAFTHSGQVSFVPPAASPWAAMDVEGQRRYWLRACIPVELSTAGFVQAPIVRRLTLGYDWALPALSGMFTRIYVTNNDLIPEAGFTNQAQIDLTKDVQPFGEKPRLGDSFYLSCDEAFVAQTTVTLSLTLGNPREPAPALPERRQADSSRSSLPSVRPSPDLSIAWEYFNGTRWLPLLSATPFPSDLLIDDFDNPIEAQKLTLRGQCASGAAVQIQERITGETQVSATVVGGEWSADLALRPGLQAYQVSALSRGGASDSRWLLVFSGTADKVPAPLAAKIDLRGDPFVVGTTTAGARIFVHNAATGKLSAAFAADATGSFAIPLSTATGLLRGRNDLLVVAQNQQGQLIAATVLTHLLGDSSDSTWGFTRSGQVSFRMPDDAAATSVNGQSGRWLRARITRGNYGVEARYEPLRDASGGLIDATGAASRVPIYQLVPASFLPPSLQTLKVSYVYNPDAQPVEQSLSENDFVVAPLSTTKQGADLIPFTPMADTRPTLYLGFRRPGAESGFANRTTTLYVSVEDVLYGEAGLASQGLDEQANVVWEYWAGQRWNRLGTRDETQALTRRGLITFIGPPEFPPRRDFGLDEALFWLRAIWERGIYSHPPQLRRVLTNTVWASHRITIENEVAGSGSGEPDQILRLTRTPVLPGQVIEVRERELPSEIERAAITVEEGADAVSVVSGPDGQPAEIWVRWHEVPDFYGSDARSRHYTLNRLSGEIRFGNGRQGLVPPPGSGNVRASLYLTGGGTLGNRPVDSITQLATTIPFIDGLSNLEPASGGADAETLEALVERGPRTLRHRDRAVVIADFEDLAAQASPDVALVRGIPTTAQQDAGAVGVIIVPRSSGPQPIPSLELLSRVHDYLAERLTPTVDVIVSGPDWIKVSVSAEVVPTLPEEATDVQTAVLARLAAFLHPLTGGLDGKGWAFGRKPYRSDLFALIERSAGVSHVRRLSVVETHADTARADRFLVYSGEHQIVMSNDA